MATETPKRKIMMMQRYKKNNSLDKLQLTEESAKNKGLSNLEKRARAKWIQTPKLNKLLNHATILGDNTKGYQRALNCATNLIYDNGKYKSHYCFNRACNVCNRIRTGKLIDTYEDDFNKLIEPYFVTLTAPNVKAEFLNDEIKRMTKIIRKIANNGRKYGVLFKGVRKLEITYNIDRADFHPHFHFIVEGEIDAGYLLEKWLKYNPESNRGAQDIKKANRDSLKELFKYAVKETGTSNRKKNDIRPIPIHALHHIYETLKGKRTFQSMGNFAQGIETETEETPILISEETNFEDSGILTWSDIKHNYVTAQGEKYSNYIPTKKDIKKRNKYEELPLLSG